MERFVLLRLHDMQRGEEVERWFNLRAIRCFDVERNEVQLNGSRSPIRVSDDSVGRLLSIVREMGSSDMCRDLCAYDFAFANIIGYLEGKFNDGRSLYRPAIADGIASRESVNEKIRCICESAFAVVEERDRLKEELSKLAGQVACEESHDKADRSFVSRIKKFLGIWKVLS